MFLSKILTVFAWFQMCFLHMVVVFGNRCDNKNHVELVDPNDHSKFECWPVPTCQEGQEPSVKPGSVHPTGTDVSCIPCGHGWFSNHDTNFRCQKCTSCGNKDVRVNCSIYRDAVCSKSCKSKTHYFNETDGQCYTCTECCGKDMSNIEPHCLLKNLRVGSVIGQPGELHCKVLLSQECDEPSQNVSTNISSVINSNSGLLERNCSRPENNVTLPSTDGNPSASREGPRCSWNSRPHILLICGLIFVVVILLFLYIRERNRRLIPRNDYLSSFVCCSPCKNCCFPCLSGPGCSADCERAMLERNTFEEELNCVPEGPGGSTDCERAMLERNTFEEELNCVPDGPGCSADGERAIPERKTVEEELKCVPEGPGCSADCQRAMLERNTFEEELNCVPDGPGCSADGERAIPERKTVEEELKCVPEGQPDSETAASSLMGFEEKLQYIPEALTIKWIPFEVEQIILKLDERKLSANNWYSVARKLGLSMDETDNIRREECREGGSPTSALLSQLTTWQNVITLRRFVRVLHQLGRHDLSKLIFDFYRNGEQQALTSSV